MFFQFNGREMKAASIKHVNLHLLPFVLTVCALKLKCKDRGRHKALEDNVQRFTDNQSYLCCNTHYVISDVPILQII